MAVAASDAATPSSAGNADATAGDGDSGAAAATAGVDSAAAVDEDDVDVEVDDGDGDDDGDAEGSGAAVGPISTRRPLRRGERARNGRRLREWLAALPPDRVGTVIVKGSFDEVMRQLQVRLRHPHSGAVT